MFALGLAAFTACNTLNSDSTGDAAFIPTPSATGVSAGRQNAARLIAPATSLHFILLQQNLADPLQFRCDPFGTGPGNPWTVLIDTVFVPTVFNQPSEYDWLATIGETDYILGLRVPVEPFFPLQFSQVEFSLRAVNPCANGHVAGLDYNPTQADYPSNDDFAANRSLIDLNGGDVALIVVGIDFAGAPANTSGYMNFLGPTGWVLFMRDNAFRSGRFYNITGALKGAPPAFYDTNPGVPDTTDDGFFESVQVNGDNFDALSEPFGNISGFPNLLVCAGAPAPGRPYAFTDLSNRNDVFAPAPGQGGGMLVIRREAFFGAQVVVNPNTAGATPAPVLGADLMLAPFSGYNETIIPAINCPDEDDNSFNGPAGVHEIGWSIFFIHGA